jgi:hypothetical protein
VKVALDGDDSDKRVSGIRTLISLILEFCEKMDGYGVLFPDGFFGGEHGAGRCLATPPECGCRY